MLQIVVPPVELWDERNEMFIKSKGANLKLEHSLISIANWEMRWHVPYFRDDKTEEQAIDYIRCMTLNKEIDSTVYFGLTQQNVEDINRYMQDDMTATRINDVKKKTGSRNNQEITSELIYYWMIQFGIPFSCDKWHINRLIMLIRVCAEESKPKKKRSTKDIASDYRTLNAARKAALNTKG